MQGHAIRSNGRQQIAGTDLSISLLNEFLRSGGGIGRTAGKKEGWDEEQD